MSKPAPVPIEITDRLSKEMLALLANIDHLENVVSHAAKCRPASNVRMFARHVANESRLDPGAASAILTALWDLRRGMDFRGQTAEEVVADLARELTFAATTVRPEWTKERLNAWAAASDRVAKALNGITADDPLMVSYKAFSLVYDREKLYREGRIYADLRPVFDSSAAKIESMLVTFTFAVEYTDGTDEKVAHLTMDRRDIENLMGQCERALAKSATLQAAFDEKKWRTITPPEAEE